MNSTPKKSRQKKYFVSAILVWCLLVSIQIKMFSSERNELHSLTHTNIGENLITVRYQKEKLPVCERNVLKLEEQNYSNRLPSCRLVHYTYREAVKCFDILSRKNMSRRTHLSSRSRTFHVVFIGDSRIRQQFHNFLRTRKNYELVAEFTYHWDVFFTKKKELIMTYCVKRETYKYPKPRIWIPLSFVIPDYDRLSDPSPIPFYYHADIDVNSTVLNLRISYQWRPLINETVLQTIRHWNNRDGTSRPHLVLLSMEVHHMLKLNGANFGLYLEKLTELSLALNGLARKTVVIWLNQYPTVDTFFERNTDIFTEKIHQWNQAVRRTLENHKNILIWDSSNPFAEEYVRGCTLSQRQTIGDYAASQTNCRDYIHTGNVGLSLATQLLFNEICNTHLVADEFEL